MQEVPKSTRHKARARFPISLNLQYKLPAQCRVPGFACWNRRAAVLMRRASSPPLVCCRFWPSRTTFRCPKSPKSHPGIPSQSFCWLLRPKYNIGFLGTGFREEIDISWWEARVAWLREDVQLAVVSICCRPVDPGYGQPCRTSSNVRPEKKPQEGYGLFDGVRQ